MGKSYKHKKLWWIAEFKTEHRNGIRFEWYKIDWCSIPYRLLEEDDNWELIEEKDWIDEVLNDPLTKVYDEFMELRWNQWRKQFREIVEKHMPKISEEELKIVLEKSVEAYDYDYHITKLLKEKWLYKE